MRSPRTKMKPGDIVRCSVSRRFGGAPALVLEIYHDVTGILRGAALLLVPGGTMWVSLDELEVVNADG